MEANIKEPHFDFDNARGKVGEDYVETFLQKLYEDKKIEVKTDYRAWETGNFYIETWQYRQPDASDKKQSGINITESDVWCFAGPNGNGHIAINVKDLKELIAETNPRETRQPITNLNTNASIGRLVPVVDVLKKIGLA